MRSGSIVLAIVVACVGCSNAPVAPRAEPAPAEMPPGVFLVVRTPLVDAVLRDARAYIERVSPGAGVDLDAAVREFEAQLGIAGMIDRTQPAFLVAATGAADRADLDAVAVFAVKPGGPVAPAAPPADEAATVQVIGRWVVAGTSAGAVDRLWPWAEQTLAAGSAPTTVAATLYVEPVRAWLVEGVLDGVGSASKGDRFAREVVVAALADVERVDAEAAISAGEANIELTVRARAGSTLAATFAAQRPATFALFEQLPLEQALGTMAGTVSLGPTGKPLRAFLEAVFAQELGPLSAPGFAMLDRVWRSTTGEYAAATSPRATIQVIGVADAVALRGELDRFTASTSKLKSAAGASMTVAAGPVSGGVPVGVLGMADPSAPAGLGMLSWAAWDGRLAFAFIDADGSYMEQVIERSRTAPAVPPTMAKILADARRHGDSLIQTYGPLDAPPFVISAGVRDGRAYLRASMPADVIRMMASASSDDE